MNSCHHVTRYETFQIRHKENKNRQQSTRAIWFSYRPDMRKFCLHEIFIPFHESFISPRHHVNTTVAQTSTRYENWCRHEFHVGSSYRPDMRRFCLHEIFIPFHESFISPRHHVNTTVAQTSTRYENWCRHEFHVGSHVKGLLQ